MQNFEINSTQIDKIKKITTEEKNFRIKNLELFKESGFPSKRLEDWKFSDFKNIVDNNFDELDTSAVTSNLNKKDILKDFDHNHIFLVNGNLHSSNFEFEDKNKIKISTYDRSTNFQFNKNPLVSLNHAFAENGYSLEVDKNYKFKKVLVIYNIFTNDIKNKILNNKNKIKIGENSELHVLEYTVNESKFKFINNVYENIILEKKSKFKNLYIQKNKNDGIFHKFLKSNLFSSSEYTNFIFSSGPKFNKLDIDCDLNEQHANCNILSAQFFKQ